MLRQVVSIVLTVSFIVCVAAPVGSALRAQGALIYIDPTSGSPETKFEFPGSGFEPGSGITVSFISPQRETIDLASNPLIVEDDGTFRLTVVPMDDLTNEPGNPHSVQRGRWIATFTLSEEVYYQQAFQVQR
jgi:hypothetical protein